MLCLTTCSHRSLYGTVRMIHRCTTILMHLPHWISSTPCQSLQRCGWPMQSDGSQSLVECCGQLSSTELTSMFRCQLKLVAQNDCCSFSHGGVASVEPSAFPDVMLPQCTLDTEHGLESIDCLPRPRTGRVSATCCLRREHQLMSLGFRLAFGGIRWKRYCSVEEIKRRSPCHHSHCVRAQ